MTILIMGYHDDDVVVVGFYSAVMCTVWGLGFCMEAVGRSTVEYLGNFGFSPGFNKIHYGHYPLE
jgi:hypothetical protein